VYRTTSELHGQPRLLQSTSKDVISGRINEDGDDEDVCACLYIALYSPVGFRTALLSRVNVLGCSQTPPFRNIHPWKQS